ncbi:MAG TPA: alkaline phosphatase family protein [Solirubrobacterales bacterium]|nr:alkaline phosphatase family protein [Solirubrobacterales bacterium]
MPAYLGRAPSIERVASLVLRTAHDLSGPLLLLGLDGVGFNAVEGLWNCNDIARLRSVIPSTSTTAWLTALTGAGVERHLVPGLFFRPGEGYEPINIAEVKPGDPSSDGLIPEIPTLFERLREAGIESHTCLGGLTAYPGIWREALFRGSNQIPSRRFSSLRPEPALAVAAAVDDVDDVLRQVPTKSVVFAYVDLDTSVHQYGYDERVIDSLRAIDVAACRWSAEGATVLAVSDHGQVPVSPSEEAVSAWERLERSPYAAGAAGGAGRARWLYAAAGREDELVGEAQAKLEEWADVFDVRQLPLNRQLRSRLGAVIALAKDPGFPLPAGHRNWEHGAASEEELLVPLAYWGEEQLRLQSMLSGEE